MSEYAAKRLRMGSEYPYDASDEFWEDGIIKAPEEVDWAHFAARGVIADLMDRRAIKRGFERVDEEIRREIVESLADIIRTARDLHWHWM
jgi:hypothetical protein